jgi:threonine dehydratase
LIPVAEIRRAAAAIEDAAVRTPLMRLDAPESPAEIFLKLECLQPVGSFKLRGALNAVRRAGPGALSTGVVTASAGNMAQGLAWAAREAGVPCTAVVPEHAPQAKLAAIERLGARVVQVPYERWWQALVDGGVEGIEGAFVHPVADEAVMAGNGTIGLELVEELPAPDTVLVPFGGGGLTVGIASALRAYAPQARVVPVEPETAVPLAASLAAGSPQEVHYRPSFVDGAGAPALLPAMWPRLRELVSESLTVSLGETAAAIRLLAERAHVVAEGAGALGLAAALSGRAGAGRIVCVISGGNIDAAVLAEILRGSTP